MENNSYPVGFYFQLTVDGESTAFQEVSGISGEMNVEEVVEGGENRYKYPGSILSSPKNLILKRGLAPVNSKLNTWCTESINSFSKPITPKMITISLLDQNQKSIMQWTFHQAYPVKFEISDFKSQENETLIEQLEFAYNYFEIKK